MLKPFLHGYNGKICCHVVILLISDSKIGKYKISLGFSRRTKSRNPGLSKAALMMLLGAKRSASRRILNKTSRNFLRVAGVIFSNSSCHSDFRLKNEIGRASSRE